METRVLMIARSPSVAVENGPKILAAERARPLAPHLDLARRARCRRAWSRQCRSSRRPTALRGSRFSAAATVSTGASNVHVAVRERGHVVGRTRQIGNVRDRPRRRRPTPCARRSRSGRAPRRARARTSAPRPAFARRPVARRPRNATSRSAPARRAGSAWSRRGRSLPSDAARGARPRRCARGSSAPRRCARPRPASAPTGVNSDSAEPST